MSIIYLVIIMVGEKVSERNPAVNVINYLGPIWRMLDVDGMLMHIYLYVE